MASSRSASRAIATNSYIFLNDVVTQTSRPSGYPANWGEFTQTSYSISPTVAAQSGYTTTMKAALAGLPSLSISLAPNAMFGDDGIYTDSTQHGLEEAVSAEWVTADNSSDTQIDAVVEGDLVFVRMPQWFDRPLRLTPEQGLSLVASAQSLLSVPGTACLSPII